MLGEDHSLLHDFPQFKDIIVQLTMQDDAFASKATHYHSIDKEIRELELNSAPIDDKTMHNLKHDRAVLKDSLYQQLIKEKG